MKGFCFYQSLEAAIEKYPKKSLRGKLEETGGKLEENWRKTGGKVEENILKIP